MDAQVNPWAAALIIILSVAIFGVKFWADGEKAHVPAPTFVRAAPGGGLWLVMDKTLLQFDAQGQYQDRIALADLHVVDLIGDVGVFSNGDLLLRAEPAAGDSAFSAGRLLRCVPETRECQYWSDLSFKKVFRVHIDADDTVFIADTTRHRVLRRSADGEDQGAVHEGLRYPNQLWREDDHLYVTVSNTGFDAVHWFAIGKHTLGDKQGSVDLAAKSGVAPGHVMGSDILRVGDVWWVNMMRSGQKDGGIYRFDNEWHLLGRLALPGGADPLVMTAFQGDIVLTDFKLRRILRFAADGETKPDLSTPEIDVLLSQWRDAEKRFAQYSQLAILAFVLLLVAGFIAAIAQLKSAGLAIAPATLAEMSQSVDDPAIQWVDVDPQLKRQQRWAAPLFFVAFAAMLVVMFPMGLSRMGWPMLAVGVIAMPLFWLQMRQLRQRIGVRGDLLILKDGRGQAAVGAGERIVYSDNRIVIDDVVVNIGNGIKSLFPKDQLMQVVFPLLKQGRYLKPSAMQQLLLKRMDPALVVPFVLIAGLMLVFLADQKGWVHLGFF